MTTKRPPFTVGGRPVTDELIEKAAEKAEAGFDTEQLVRRTGGRPLLGSAPAGNISVRLPPSLRQQLRERAQVEDVAEADVIRRALGDYLDAKETEREAIDDQGNIDSEILIPEGLARATIFLPLRDPLPLPEGRYLLVGDELPELAGTPIFVEADDGELMAVPNSEGHAPIEIRFWRLEEIAAEHPGLQAAARACVASGLVAQRWDVPESAVTQKTVQVVVQITFLVQKIGNTMHGPILEQGLDLVQRLQTTYNMIVGGAPAELLTQEQLPFLVPVVVSPGPPQPLRPGNLQMFAPLPMATTVERFDFSALTFTEMLSEDEARRIVLGAGSLPLQPALPVHQFRTDARVQLHRYGNYRQSIIASAAAAESLASTIYEMLIWEEGGSPATAADRFSRGEGILKRTKREMSSRLGGTWDEKRPGPVSDWSTNILKVRNAIVHLGHPATRIESIRALESLNAFVALFADRFATPAVLRKFPKTAILSVPRASFESRFAWSEAIQSLSDQNYGEWWYSFREWQLELDSHLDR
jgi:hypothetical protein